MDIKKRGWVKNALIGFLALMLVLTFFSNTIMNYSLPEVAGQYSSYAEIRSAIRGQGTVVANMSHEVELSESRQIATVEVKSGAYVEPGQLLLTLEDSDSEEVKNATKNLENKIREYNKKLLQMKGADYGDENRAIALKQEALQELINKKGDITKYADILTNAKKVAKDAQNRYDALAKEQAKLEENLLLLDSTDEYDYRNLITESMKKLQTEIEKALADEETAQKALDAANRDLENNSGSGSGGNASAIKEQITAKQNQITNIKLTMQELKFSILALVDATGVDQYTEYKAAKAAYELDDTDANLAALNAEIEKLLVPSAHNDTAIKASATTYVTTKTSLIQAESDLANLEADYHNATSDSSDYYKYRVNEAKDKLQKAKDKTEGLKTTFNREMKDLKNVFKEQIANKKTEVKSANETLTAANAAVTEAEKNAQTSPSELDAQIKSAQREIEDLLYNLAKQKDDDKINEAVAQLDMEAQRLEIEEMEQDLERLKAKAQEKEVYAKYGGTITSVSCIPGDKVQAGTPIITIDVNGKGFTTSISVTNEQAQKLRVGDTTTITQWWGEGITLTVTNIRNDPETQGRSKKVDFDIQGDVYAGQNLNFSIGERNQSYDCVFPNSAIREDSNGTFILIAKAKRTPLGTRYIATRLDVTVLAKDDMNTAISRDNYEYDFVITTATKPVEPGSQVRLIGQ